MSEFPEQREIDARLEWPPDDPGEPWVSALIAPAAGRREPSAPSDDLPTRVSTERPAAASRPRSRLRDRQRAVRAVAAAVIVVPIAVGAGLAFALTGESGPDRARPPATTERARSTSTMPVRPPAPLTEPLAPLPAPDPAVVGQTSTGRAASAPSTPPAAADTSPALVAQSPAPAATSSVSAPVPSAPVRSAPPPSAPPPSSPSADAPPASPLCQLLPLLCR